MRLITGQEEAFFRNGGTNGITVERKIETEVKLERTDGHSLD